MSMRKVLEKSKIKFLTREEVRSADSWAINELKVPGVVLMENAGRNFSEILLEKIKDVKDPEVLIICGSGNNGGDGYVIARHLLREKVRAEVVVCADREKIKGDADTNLRILEKMGVKIDHIEIDPQGLQALKRRAQNCCYIVDGIFGTGIKGQVRGKYPELVNTINELGIKVASIDIPSGLDCDTGEPLGVSIEADFTVTFLAPKKGFENPRSKAYTGQVYVADIGVDLSLM